MAPSREEEHDARDKILLYEDTMLEDVMEFGDPYVCALPQQELKIAELIAAYNTGNIDEVVRIDEHEEHRSKGNLIIAVLVSIMQVSPKHHPQRVTALLEAY